MTAPRIPVQDLIDSDALRIRWMPGTSSRLVVVFGGVQHNLGGVPMDEFAGSVSENGVVHVLFINDLNCTWYSVPGLYDQICTVARDLMDREGLSDIRLIGNSMGGYGALLFAAPLGAQVAFALSPQISMHPDVIAEERWQHFRPAFGPDLAMGVHQLMPPSGALQMICTFGARDASDLRQAALLPQGAEQVHVYKVKGCGHDAVKHFKAAGVLREVVQAGLAGDTARLGTVYAAFERQTHRPARDLLDKVLRRVRRIFGA